MLSERSLIRSTIIIEFKAIYKLYKLLLCEKVGIWLMVAFQEDSSN